MNLFFLFLFGYSYTACVRFATLLHLPKTPCMGSSLTLVTNTLTDLFFAGYNSHNERNNN
jgi:hypothetical protein